MYELGFNAFNLLTKTGLMRGTWLPVLRDLPADTLGQVGLSFDDGPTAETTPALIDLFRRHGGTATFFVTGERAERAPHLIAALVEAGHDVFSHGWRHIAYDNEPAAVMHKEMTRTEALLSRFRPTPEPYMVRLPYVSGLRSAAMHRAIRAWNPAAQLAFWRFSFEDFRLACDCSSVAELRLRCSAAAEAVLRQRRLPGSILLLHEQPYGSSARLDPKVAPMLTECVLEGLASAGLRASKLCPA